MRKGFTHNCGGAQWKQQPLTTNIQPDTYRRTTPAGRACRHADRQYEYLVGELSGGGEAQRLGHLLARVDLRQHADHEGDGLACGCRRGEWGVQGQKGIAD